MGQLVQAYGHTIEFPDGMSQDDIVTALKKNALSVPKAPDPSAGGSSLNIAGFDTGIPTPQWLDRGLSGAGKSVSDMGNGLRQLGAMAGLGDPAKVQADIDEAKKLDTPLMNTGAGLAGNVAGNVAMTMLPAAGLAKGASALGMARTAATAGAFVNPSSFLGATGAGAVMGGIQPTATGDSRLLNTAIGGGTGLAGQALVSGMGRIAQPVQNALDPIRQKAIDTLKNAGVPLDLSQITGSPTWARIKSSLGDNLFTLGGQADKQAEQKAAFNNAALGLIGSGGPAATSDVMGQAQGRINGVFKDVLDRNSVAPDPTIVSRLAATHASALENEKQPVANIIGRIFDSMDPQTGQIPGQVAYGIKKDLDRMAMTADTTQKYLALQAKTALMDGINGSLSGADQQAFATARGQASNMYKLEPAIATDGTGDISASRLANILGQKANRSASVYGKGPQDMVDLAQAGKQVLGDKTPNSGTAARMFAMTALPGMALGGVDAVHQYGEDGDLLGALGHAGMVAGSVIAAPKAAQFVLNSPRMVGLLANGVEQPVVRGLLQTPAESAIAGQAVRSLPAAAARSALLPANPTYAQYLAAFDQAPDWQTKKALGDEYQASLPATQ